MVYFFCLKERNYRQFSRFSPVIVNTLLHMWELRTNFRTLITEIFKDVHTSYENITILHTVRSIIVLFPD